MKEQRFLQIFLAIGTFLCMANLLLYFFSVPKGIYSSNPSTVGFIAQTYMGPTVSTPEEASFIRIEVLVRDSPALAGVHIQSVTFNGRSIPLRTRDVMGKRGSASFQLPPGNYPLEWVVEKDKIVWPRLITHKEIVTLDPRDLWVQILIEGDQATIN